MSRNQDNIAPTMARSLRAILTQGDLAWAESMHVQLNTGHLRPSQQPVSPPPRGFYKEELLEQVARTDARQENRLRLKALIKAIRILNDQTGVDPKRTKKLDDLERFLASEWGIERAADAVGGDDRDLVLELRRQWGQAQLPPEGVLVGGSNPNEGRPADWLLIENAVRRLG